MTQSPDLKLRKHARLSGFDYRANRAYFVTLCTGGRRCIFGEIEREQFRPTQRGLVVERCWQDIPRHHSFVELDAFVLMPYHLHGVLLFVGNTATHELSSVAATPASPPRPAKGPASRSLSSVIGSFKSAVSRQINLIRPGAAKGLWQQNYYEHVIRNDRSLEAIREYIQVNPSRWELDEENSNVGGEDSVAAFVALMCSPRFSTEGDAGVAATGGMDAE